MSAWEWVRKILELVFTLGAKAIDDAARGDDEAKAQLEEDHEALVEFLANSAARRRARRARNDERIEQLERDQAKTDPDATPVPK